MKKLMFLALLSMWLALPAVAQSAKSSGQFAVTISGFAPVSGCQPGPGVAFPACTLPPMSLGVPYSALLPTIGATAPLTCTVSAGTLPAGITISSSGTSCVLGGTPTSTISSAFTVSYTGS